MLCKMIFAQNLSLLSARDLQNLLKGIVFTEGGIQKVLKYCDGSNKSLQVNLKSVIAHPKVKKNGL